MLWQGLSQVEVLKHKQQFGDNSLPEKEPITPFGLLLNQFKSPLIYILLLVVVVSLLFRENLDAMLVSAVILLDVFMGFIQEYSAQNTLKKLQKIVKNSIFMIRDGQRQQIETKNLVPDDIVLLGSGDKVPADCQVLEGSVFVSEAILTGEEELIEKIAERKKNSLYMGTVVLSGRCTAKVIKIGLQTEIGKIGIDLTAIKETETPLQIRLKKLSRQIAIFVSIIGLLIFVLGVTTNHPLWEMIRFSLLLSVAAIPEGLPIAVTVILSLGMNRILKRQGLVKKLLSIETLGSTSVICTDKTGTITEGIMRVVNVETNNLSRLLYGLTILNTQRNSIDIAIWKYLQKTLKRDPQTTLDRVHILHEEIFESEKKYSLSIVDNSHQKDSFILGAPEIVLAFCSDKEARKQAILSQFYQWTKDGLRVVGLISKKGTQKAKTGYHWLGLIGIEDPVRKGVKEAIVKAGQAGISVKIVTGDFRFTAEKVAANIGLKIFPQSIMEGEALEKISITELKKSVSRINLFCRVSPHQKMKIVKALQSRREIVAMTGDGVNDVLALKKADIGVVVGTASDVAKETGDLILLNNNFKTIVEACEEGRVIYQNIIKVVGYTLSNSLVEVILIVGAMIFDLPFPLTIIQLLFLHLICDGPPDIALGFEPADPHIMDEKPRNPQKDHILSWPMLFLVFAISATAGIISLLIFNKQLGIEGLDNARTMVFATIGTIDLIYIFSYKNLSRPVYRIKELLNNKVLIFSVLYGFSLLTFALYTPFGQKLLNVVPLKISLWPVVMLVALSTVAWVELIKKIKNLSTS